MKQNNLCCFKVYLFLALLPLFSLSSFSSLPDFSLLNRNNMIQIEYKTSDSFYWNSTIMKDVGNKPVCIAIGDINHDGQNDIVTANQEDNTVSILLWNATILNWNDQIIKSVGYSPESVYIGDAFNKGYQDIIVSSLDNIVTILSWNSTIKNWNSIVRSVGDDPECVIIEDANNDGNNDIITANMGDYDVSILLWNETIENWDEEITKHVGYVPYSISLGDVNEDGYNDIVSANYGLDNNITILLWNNTIKNWEDKITENAGSNPYWVYVSDVNNDATQEIVVASLNGEVIILGWNETSKRWNILASKTVGAIPRSVFVEDANDDGLYDIVTANYGDNTVSILLWNHIFNNWDPEITISVGNEPHSVNIGDANNDGTNDIVTANYGDNTISILIGRTHELNNPSLYPISPNNNSDGLIELNWSDTPWASEYLVYRDNSSIFTINGIHPVAIVNQSTYNDTVLVNGNYYYVIVARNATHVSKISNCERVFVIIPLNAPKLDPIFPNFLNTNEVVLNWSEVFGARIYYIFRDTNLITNPTNSSLIGTTLGTNFTDKNIINGIYYYAIAASDYYANSSLSNCIKIIISIQSTDRPNLISGFFLISFLIGLILNTIIIVIKNIFKMLNPKNKEKS